MRRYLAYLAWIATGLLLGFVLAHYTSHGVLGLVQRGFPACL